MARDIKVDFILIGGFFKCPFHFIKLSYQALTSTLGDTGVERVVTLLLKQTVSWIRCRETITAFGYLVPGERWRTWGSGG